MPDSEIQADTKAQPKIQLRYFIPYLLIFLLVPFGTFLLGSWTDLILSLPPFPPFPFNIISGVIVMVGGAAVGIKATRQLHKVGKGLPWGEATKASQSSTLVTTGIFTYTRNPMTFGYTLLPLGMGLLFRSLGMSLLIPAIVLGIQIIIIKRREEPSLIRRFGEKYLDYKRKTPFLVPSIRMFFAQHRKNRVSGKSASQLISPDTS
ncbi:MAG: methyltransferase family protein [Promethearchaeota archaeon]